MFINVKLIVMTHCFHHVMISWGWQNNSELKKQCLGVLVLVVGRACRFTKHGTPTLKTVVLVPSPTNNQCLLLKDNIFQTSNISTQLLSHWTKKPTNTHSHLAFVFCQWERVQSAFTPRSDDSAVVRGMLLAPPLWFWWKHDTRVDPQVFTLFPAQRYDECWRSGCWHVNSFSPPLSLFRRSWVWIREWQKILKK